MMKMSFERASRGWRDEKIFILKAKAKENNSILVDVLSIPSPHIHSFFIAKRKSMKKNMFVFI